MTDPLESLFGTPALDLFRAGEFCVVDGDPSRLPQWMRSGALVDPFLLCRTYKGPVEIAHGGLPGGAGGDGFIGEGGQNPVRGASPDALLRMGLTVYFTSILELVPQARDFLKALEHALGLPDCSSMGAFVNAPGSGLPIHHDSHDQLLFQLSGKKTISYATNPHARHPGLPYSPATPPHAHFATVYRTGFYGSATEVEAAGMTTVTLNPGSCLFMPAGTWHQTKEQEETCISLVTVVRAPSWQDLLLNALSYRVGQDERMRAPAYGLLHGPLDDSFAPRANEMEAALREMEVREVTRAWLARSPAKGEHPDFPFQHYVSLPGTKLTFISVSADVVRCRVRPVRALEFREIEFHPEAQAIVQLVTSLRRVFSVEEIIAASEGFEPQEVEAFLVQLASVGVIRPVPSERWPRIPE